MWGSVVWGGVVWRFLSRCAYRERASSCFAPQNSSTDVTLTFTLTLTFCAHQQITSSSSSCMPSWCGACTCKCWTCYADQWNNQGHIVVCVAYVCMYVYLYTHTHRTGVARRHEATASWPRRGAGEARLRVCALQMAVSALDDDDDDDEIERTWCGKFDVYP